MKKHSLLSAALMAAVFVLPSESSLAQVEVVESNNRLITNDVRLSAQAAAPAADSAASGASEVFYQLQLLQQEVSQLRGLVEEQSFAIKRLKQQRLDDYLSIDKRLSGLATGGGTAPAVTTAPAGTSKPAATTFERSPTNLPVAAGESQQYRAAIDLILKKKDYAQADVALNQYLTDFPKGRYAANSQYWLGELALLSGDLEKSRQWFSKMVTEWPDHAKVPDANYKMGTVYHKLGDSDKARTILESVATGSSNASRLASSYLSANFQ